MSKVDLTGLRAKPFTSRDPGKLRQAHTRLKEFISDLESHDSDRIVEPSRQSLSAISEELHPNLEGLRVPEVRSTAGLTTSQ
jgi:hypothetical protein